MGGEADGGGEASHLSLQWRDLRMVDLFRIATSVLIPGLTRSSALLAILRRDPR